MTTEQVYTGSEAVIMKHHPFGPTKREVPILGQGTWHLESADRPRAIATLRRGIDLGMTHIDTAEMYGSGEAEEIAAEAIRGRRDEVFVVSKVLPYNASRKGTIAACERSLRHLGTDRLDCYLLHWRGSYSLEETVGAFEALRRAGKILSWGVSNFDVDDLEELWKLAGPGRIACNQVLYHLNERSIENAVLPWCEQHDIAVVGYTPFGKRQVRPDSEAGRVLSDIAARHDATARQVALAFLARTPSLFTIPKASSLEHVEENAGAGELHLSAEELEMIDSAFPRGNRRRLPMW